MDKHDRFTANLAAVALEVFGWACIVVCDESRSPTVCVCLGIICLAAAHFVLGYVNGLGFWKGEEK